MEERELREMKAKIDETHKMVSKLYRFEKNRRFWRALKLILIAVIIVGAYFAILPIFKRTLDTYNSFSSGISNIQNFKLFGDNSGEQAPE